MIRVPYPILLVLGGLALGFVPGLPAPQLDPDTFFFFFLPPLLYSEAVLFSTEDLKEHAAEISLLAVGLVLATTVTVATLAHVLADLPWAAAFVMGAVVGPTDPISATSVIRRLGVSERIVTILEGEALLNDGTALVVYRLAVGAVGAATLSVGHAAVEFVWVSLGGAVIGAAIAWVWARINVWARVPEVEITLSILMPLGAYLLSEHLGVSGVLATVTAGLMVGRRLNAVSPSARLWGHGFWEVVAFLLNSTLFLLVGLSFPDVLDRLETVSPGKLASSAIAIAAAVMVLRLVWMFLMPRVVAVLEERKSGRPDVGELLVLGWSGMRGGVSLAAALSIPITVDGQPFPGRDRIIFLAYMVLLATLVLPGLTLGPLVSALGIGTGQDHAGAEARAREHILRAALEHIDELADSNQLPEGIAADLRALYDARLGGLPAEAQPATPDADGNREAALRARRGVIGAERAALAELQEEGRVGIRTARQIDRELEVELDSTDAR
jgi:CPA1 family monovalent cation:H+ antiporter